MDPIVGLIAIVRLKVHGHCPIACDTEAVNQLLEIGTALLGMPPLKLNRSRVLTIVSTPDHHAGSVVVDPFHLEIETLSVSSGLVLHQIHRSQIAAASLCCWSHA